MTYVNYVVSDEEDRVINAIANSFIKRADSKGPQKGPQSSVKVYNAAFGLIPVEQWQVSLKNRSLSREPGHGNVIEALENIYREDTQDRVHYYLLTDPERYFQNEEVVRRILNIIHQVNSNIQIVKCLYFIGASLVVPPKLASYVHVIREDNLPDEEIQEILSGLTPKTREKLPSDAHTWFRGLTAYQVTSAAGQAIVMTKKDPDPKKRGAITQEHILQYKRERIRKTDLLKLVDTSSISFDQVGGLDRFKAWAKETRHSWSAKGKAFGLRPPKGVLCVGVWGCGKSLSVKALAREWNLPLVQLELGKLRDAGVGVTEANTYRVTRFAEAMAPCIVWCDEADKSFAGAQSSARTDAGTTSRSLGILSTWLQETSAEITLAMTLNSLATLPVEFTNRMSERFFFDIPSEDDRVDILKIHLSAVGKLSKAQIAEVNLRRLAEVSENMVPREMEQAVDAALRKSFVLDRPCLDCEVLEQELRTKPRILKTMDTEVREVINWVGYDEVSRDGLRARFASTKRSSNTARLLEGGLE